MPPGGYVENITTVNSSRRWCSLRLLEYAWLHVNRTINEILILISHVNNRDVIFRIRAKTEYFMSNEVSK